jgi:hypothetical protein
MIPREHSTDRRTLPKVIWPSISLTIFLATMATIFVWWHRYICTDPAALGVRRFYAYRSTISGKGVSGYIDLVLPAMLIGFVTGLAGALLRPRWTCVHTLIMGTGLTVLQPILAQWVPPNELWWLPAGKKWPLWEMLGLEWRGLLLCGVFAYLGRLFGQRWWGLGDNMEHKTGE